MPKFAIEGNRKLSGRLAVSGAKNSALPVLAATLIAAGEYQINNVPSLKDVEVMLRLLEGFGLQVKKAGQYTCAIKMYLSL